MSRIDEHAMLNLLSKGFDLAEVDVFIQQSTTDAVDRDGRTLLMSAVVKNKVKLVKYLIENNYDVNATDNQGMTPLHYACIHGFYEMAELLINNSASIDATDFWGNTPLWRAAMTINDKFDALILLLIRHGADIEKKNASGVSPKILLS